MNHERLADHVDAGRNYDNDNLTRHGDDRSEHARHYTTLRLGLWSVCVYAGLGLLGFAVFASFWPPPGQDLDASAITR